MAERRPQARRSVQGGFSLLELLVALSILAGIALAATEALRFAGVASTRAKAMQDEAAALLT
ncbi:MAG: type II secretion system protein, partial [Pseudomonadota bacterium]